MSLKERKDWRKSERRVMTEDDFVRIASKIWLDDDVKELQEKFFGTSIDDWSFELDNVKGETV